MFARRVLIPLALVVVAVGCSDEGQPTTGPQPSSQAPHFLRWAGNSSPQFSANDASSQGDAGVLQASRTDGLMLERYTATFWAVRGEQRSVEINYLTSTGDVGSQFLRLASVDPANVPGVGDLAPGDSVLITVSVDPYDIIVSLEPAGLLFANPTEFAISYSGAGSDLNGDGVVDGTDAWIESQALAIWKRDAASQTWTKTAATQSLADQSLTGALSKFSEYAVSW
jgi:hypothetical protein